MVRKINAKRAAWKHKNTSPKWPTISMLFPAQAAWCHADMTLGMELSWIGAWLPLITAGRDDGLAMVARQF
jgi:hypothetical protein